MRVWCVGAGAVGGTIAARLARSGVEPLVLDANLDHVRRLREPGLEIGGLDGGVVTKLAAYTPSDADGELEQAADAVLLAVRSSATRSALEPLVPRLTAASDVVSLQNGINEDEIAGIVGPDRTIGCVVGIGATWIEPGRIDLDAEGELVVGRLDGTVDARLERVRDLLGRAFPTRVTTNVRGGLWGKMLVNSMTVLGALGGMLTGELLAPPERRRVVAGVLAEGARVAAAEGVELPDVLGRVPAVLADDPDRWHAAMDEALVRFGARFGAIRSVTWRDIELGRPTEIDAVTGEIVRRGKERRVPTPLCASAYAMLREIEHGERSPGARNLEDLARIVVG